MMIIDSEILFEKLNVERKYGNLLHTPRLVDHYAESNNSWVRYDKWVILPVETGEISICEYTIKKPEFLVSGFQQLLIILRSYDNNSKQ